MKTKPMDHQVVGLARSDGKRNFAFIMEQGTGKTWITLADAERCYLLNKIDAIAVIAPNGVHTNWVRREIPMHVEIPCVTFAWRGTPSTKKAKADIERMYRNAPAGEREPFRVFAINVEAMNSANGYEALKRFLIAYRVMVIVDESTRIKNPNAKRSKKVCELGKLGEARRILSGTPLTRAPTDLFMQFNFLKEGLLGTKSYRAFVAEFSVLLDPSHPKMIAIMRKLAGKTRGIPQVVATDDDGIPQFRNLEKLSNLIAPHSYRVRKKDCLDLPDKIYKRAYFELTPNQRKVYDTLKNEYSYLLERDGTLAEDVSFEAIAARTKLKQVTSGFINVFGEPQLLPPEDNPRMGVFKSLVEGLLETDPDAQFIVWAIYEQELLQIKQFIDSLGITSELYYGATKPTERERIIDEFQGGKIQAFIGNASAGGIGITLTKAETTFYYSCSDDNELRLQSEDRNHRIGTIHNVVYWDLIGEDTLDEKIAMSNAMKTHLADVVIDRQPA